MSRAHVQRASLALACACAACGGSGGGFEPHVPEGDAGRGVQAIEYFECTSCHVIPGVDGPQSYVGPQLTGFKHHVYIAGKFPNTPEVLIHWVRDAPSLAPETAMPAMDMTEAQARDIAAYLYTLR